jgi:phosphoesterase RecJ-like protein
MEKLRLISRALEKIERYEGDALSIVYLESGDFEATGSSEALSEGVIDFVRSIDGTSVAAVVRDRPAGGRSARKVSLRSTNGEVDVSAIAREQGGGGHRRAAGFSTDLTYPELVELLSARVREQL